MYINAIREYTIVEHPPNKDFSSLSLFILNVTKVPKQSHSFTMFFRVLKNEDIFYFQYFYLELKYYLYLYNVFFLVSLCDIYSNIKNLLYN